MLVIVPPLTSLICYFATVLHSPASSRSMSLYQICVLDGPFVFSTQNHRATITTTVSTHTSTGNITSSLPTSLRLSWPQLPPAFLLRLPISQGFEFVAQCLQARFVRRFASENGSFEPSHAHGVFIIGKVNELGLIVYHTAHHIFIAHFLSVPSVAAQMWASSGSLRFLPGPSSCQCSVDLIYEFSSFSTQANALSRVRIVMIVDLRIEFIGFSFSCWITRHRGADGPTASNST